MTQDVVQLPATAMLMGSPRSGTTWLAKLVDSHPRVLYRHEPDSVRTRSDIPFVPTPDQVQQWVPACKAYIAEILGESGSKSAGSQPMFSKDYRGPLSEQLRRAIIYGLKGGERVFGNSSLLANYQVPDLLRQGQGAEALVLIKSVSSLCRTYMFSQACPGMRFVHIVRHPCAYVASTVRGKKLGLLSDDAYIETLARMPNAVVSGLTMERLREMSREEQLAARWMLQNQKVMDEMRANPLYKRVIYEELCSQPLEIVAGLFEFLGLAMTDQTREFISESSGSKAEEVKYFDVKRDSSRAATGWQRELSADQIERIRSVVSHSGVGQLYFSE